MAHNPKVKRQSAWDWWFKTEDPATPPKGKKQAKRATEATEAPPPVSKWRRGWNRWGAVRPTWVQGQRGTVPPDPSKAGGKDKGARRPVAEKPPKAATPAAGVADSSTDEGAAHYTGPAPTPPRRASPLEDSGFPANPPPPAAKPPRQERTTQMSTSSANTAAVADKSPDPTTRQQRADEPKRAADGLMQSQQRFLDAAGGHEEDAAYLESLDPPQDSSGVLAQAAYCRETAARRGEAAGRYANKAAAVLADVG